MFSRIAIHQLTPISKSPISQKMKLKKNMVYFTHPDM